MPEKKAMMTANKDSNFEIPVAEQGDYHLKRITKVHLKKEKRYRDDVSIVVLSVRDFNDMQKVDEKYSYKGRGDMTVIHNPTLKKVEPIKPKEPEKEVKKPIKTKRK